MAEICGSCVGKCVVMAVCMIGTRPLANACREKNGRVRLATNSPSVASAYFFVI